MKPYSENSLLQAAMDSSCSTYFRTYDVCEWQMLTTFLLRYTLKSVMQVMLRVAKSKQLCYLLLPFCLIQLCNFLTRMWSACKWKVPLRRRNILLYIRNSFLKVPRMKFFIRAEASRLETCSKAHEKTWHNNHTLSGLLHFFWASFFLLSILH